MNRREDLETRYDAMAPEVVERAYGDVTLLSLWNHYLCHQHICA